MVSSDSLSDVLGSDKNGKVNSRNWQPKTLIYGISSDSSDDFKTNNNDDNSYKALSSELKKEQYSQLSEETSFIKSEHIDESLNLSLHLSEESVKEENINTHSTNHKFKVKELSSSEETYLSLNASPLTSGGSVGESSSHDLSSKKHQCHNTPDMFTDSQNLQSSEAVLQESSTTNTTSSDHLMNSGSPLEWKSQDDLHAEEPLLVTNKSENPRVCGEHQEECYSHDSEFSGNLLQGYQGFRTSPNHQSDTLDDFRERQEEWSTQELTQVTQSLELRKKQVKRLIMAVIRKRQMADETLDAFKKRLKRF